LQFAVKHEIKNLTIIIDSNKLQAMDFITDVLDKEADDNIKRIQGFGLSPVVCPGHDAVRLADLLRKAKASSDNKPSVIIAKTVKGFGLKCMENVPKFHFRIPTDDELSMGKSY
jgi:transketolase